MWIGGIEATKQLYNKRLILWTNVCTHLGLASHPTEVSYQRKSVCGREVDDLQKQLRLYKKDLGCQSRTWEEKRCPGPALAAKTSPCYLILKAQKLKAVCMVEVSSLMVPEAP